MCVEKKICFVMLNNVYLSPYLGKYLSIIECEYDIIYWNRHNIDEKTSARNQYSFNYLMSESKGKISKLLGYIKFRFFAAKILKDMNYDGIIVFTTSAGILLNNILRKKYYKKYVIDIRDYTLENNSLFLKFEKNLIEDSVFTIISSKGYLKFLPKFSDYILVHNNINLNDEVIEKFIDKNKNSKTIKISYIGLIRFHNQNKKIIDIFGGDNRFLIRFIGKDALKLSGYCKKKNITNIELIDWFPPEKTLDYYYETDIICNLYGNKTPLLDYALSNKLYYAALLCMPILVCKDTYMAEISSKYGFGYILELEEKSEKDKLINYYRNIDWEKFHRDCKKFNEVVDEENDLFSQKILSFVDEI